MRTAKELVDFINANLQCFEICGHQGKSGPGRCDPVPVVEGDLDAAEYAEAECREDQVTILDEAVESAWLARGNHEGISLDWLNSCSGCSCDLPELPDEIEEYDDE